MYTPEAAGMRSCTAIRADGLPCRAWAVWRRDEQRCAAHSSYPRRTRAGCRNSWPYMPPPKTPAHYKPCHCVAYAWPHRPGSGICRWPLEPLQRLTTRAGTHSGLRSRLRGPWKAWERNLDLVVRATKAHRLPRLSDAQMHALATQDWPWSRRGRKARS